MSENEEVIDTESPKENNNVSETVENSGSNDEIKASEDSETEEEAEEVHQVLPYPERVPNAEKGADHAHSYVMIKILVFLVVFSLIIAKFTSPF
tara:strand:- start:25286 stop:25567 length:282 start_codon:yes stop_codon:yes gene_type:complete